MNNFGPDSVHVVRCMDLLPVPLSSKHVSPHFAAAFAASYFRDKKELVFKVFPQPAVLRNSSSAYLSVYQPCLVDVARLNVHSFVLAFSVLNTF